MFYKVLFSTLVCSIAAFAGVREISSESFDAEIRSGKVLVDFYGPWCGPCKRLAPVLDQVAEEEKVGILKVNIDKEPELTEKYKVKSVPTVVMFEDGKEKARFQGFQDKSAVKRFIKTGEMN